MAQRVHTTMGAKKNQEEDAQSEGAASSMINREIRAFLRNNKVWEMKDFDGSIRQCLHAIHGFGGILGIRDALDKLSTSSCGKARAQYMNPKGYIHKILKNCVRELRQQSHWKKTENKPVSDAASSSRFAALFPCAPLLWKPCCPTPLLPPSGVLWSPVWQGGQDEAQGATVTSSPVLTTSKDGPHACLILATTIHSTHVEDLAPDQGEEITLTETSQNQPSGDASPAADFCDQAPPLFEPSEASTEHSFQPTAEIDAESFTDSGSDEEDFLLVSSFCKWDSKGEGFGQEESDSRSSEHDGFVLL